MSNVTSALRFTADLSKYAVQLKGHLELFAQHVAIAAARAIVVGDPELNLPGTPHDTGHARSSWWLEGHTAEPSPNPASVVDQLPGIVQALMKVRLGEPITFSNNAPYIRRLEWGWSQQAPAGMVRLTALAAQEIGDRVAKQMGSTA